VVSSNGKKVTRKELYDLVWTEPVSRLSGRCGLSDVGFKKVCNRLNVPTPPRGYWAKKRHGHDVKPDALPPPGDGPTEHVFQPKKNASTPEKKSPSRSPSQDLPEINIPKRLTRPLPLVKAVRERMTESTDQFGRLRIREFKASPVCVSPSSAGRALRLLQAIVKAAGELGWTASIGRSRTETTYLEVEDTDVHFRLFEKSRQVERSKPKKYSYQPDWEYEPTGTLRIELTQAYSYQGQKKWSIRKGKTGIEKIESFLREVRKVVAFKKEERRRRKKKKRRREAEKRRKEEAERRQKKEEARRSALERQADRHGQARRLRRYIEEIERRAAQEDLSPKRRETCREWLRWAREHADRIDPLSSGLPF
jgi:hypothetical protein